MRFTARFFSIISGVAFITIRDNKVFSLSNCDWLKQQTEVNKLERSVIFEMNRRKLRLNRRIWGMNPRKIGMMVDVNCSICRADCIGSCNDKRNICHMHRHARTDRCFYDDRNRNCVFDDPDYDVRFTGNHNSFIHRDTASVETMSSCNVNVFRNPNSCVNCDSADGRDGRITDNRNSYINCVESSVEILDNRNLNADIVRSTVKVIDQSNCKLSATASNIEMRSNNNVRVEANDAWCKFEDNSNLEYKGTGGVNQFLSKFVDNRNCEVSGKDNNILAFSNRNLSVSGDNNHLDVSKTRNHSVQAAALGSNGNAFSVRSCAIDGIQFSITYAGAAVIKDEKYQLGIFIFDITTGTNRINVTFKEDDGVVYSVVDSSSNKVVLKADKNGAVQTLELNGDRLETVSTNSINIFVNNV